MSEPARRAAFDAYGAGRRLNTNPRDVMLMVHERLLGEYGSAKLAYERGALDEMCRHTAAATKLLTGLVSTFTAAKAQGEPLRLFYSRLITDTNRMQSSGNVSAAMQSIIARIGSLYSSLIGRELS